MKIPDPKLYDVQPFEDECRHIEDITIHYTLCRFSTPHQACFAVEICTEEECAMQIIAKDRDRAQRIYEMLINEYVTPCTLTSILHDLIEEEELQHYCQNLLQTPKEALYKFR